MFVIVYTNLVIVTVTLIVIFVQMSKQCRVLEVLNAVLCINYAKCLNGGFYCYSYMSTLLTGNN
jgi:hypothetical protein